MVSKIVDSADNTSVLYYNQTFSRWLSRTSARLTLRCIKGNKNCTGKDLQILWFKCLRALNFKKLKCFDEALLRNWEFKFQSGRIKKVVNNILFSIYLSVSRVWKTGANKRLHTRWYIDKQNLFYPGPAANIYLHRSSTMKDL